MERRTEYVVACLAAVKAGSAYLILELAYPPTLLTLARRAMELLPDARLLNVYSCSETHEVAAGDLRELVEDPESTYCAIGAPMDPERLYLLDAGGEGVPEGESGEWLQKIDVAPPEEGSPGEVLQGASPSADELWEGHTYEAHNARRALSEGPTRPAIDGDLMETYARYFARQGWTAAPVALQKTSRRG